LLALESNQFELDKKNMEKKSTMHLLYKNEIENKFQQNIHDIK